ncbi:MAG TPA: NUDIX domain-containing protein [Candidatus Saccharimonadales bacterium]|jgi:ADP-ribose pyrophosphatase YjhB (NUDIX family)
MDKVILTLGQQELDLTMPFNDRKHYFERRAARAVLRDESGKIALMYAGQRGYYKLPGGGIDDNEEITDALTRELLEETGCNGEILRELGTVVEWREFDKMHQISYAFEVIKTVQVSSPSFTQSEIDEGFEVRWVEGIDEAIKIVELKSSDEDVEVSFMAQRDAAILRASAA